MMERIDLAYSKLGLRESFIAAVMTKLKREVSDKVSTAGTNGSWVRFNEEWCSKIDDEELFGLVLHESCHVVLMHMWRREDRDPHLWNYANDAIINAYIRKRGWKLPKGGVHIDWVSDEHSSEYVYNKLKQEQQDSDEDGQPQAGGFDGNGDLADAEDEATRVDMQATIVAAAQMAKDCGQGSSLIDRVLENVGQSSVNWRDVARSMMTESTAADYTYNRPSRRFIGSGLYLPSLRTESLGGLAIGFDVSGSVGQRECNQIALEIQTLADDLQPEFVEVVYCDDQVTHVERFERDDKIQLHPKGGGGTRFKPVFDYFDETGERYCGMIFFTDLEGNLRECEEPPHPVIWADIGTGRHTAPFGTHVKVTL
jgi:predicted metal-dependent peptidase